MSKRTKPKQESEEKDTIIFRLWAPYSRRIVEQARAARVEPNQFARLATMAMVDGGFLDLSERMKRLESVLISFRKDFNQVVDDPDTD